MKPSIAAVSFDLEGAALATGVSEDTIRRAWNAGDLEAHYPTVEGRAIKKPLIAADELRRWVLAGAVERKTA